MSTTSSSVEALMPLNTEAPFQYPVAFKQFQPRRIGSRRGLSWIVAVILTFIVVLAILFMLQPCYVTKHNSKGNVVLDTGKLILWSVIFTVIIVLVLWIAKKSSMLTM